MSGGEARPPASEVPELGQAAPEVPELVEGTGRTAPGVAPEVPEPVEGTGRAAPGAAREVPEPVEGTGRTAPGAAPEVPEPVEGTGRFALGVEGEVPEPVEGTGRTAPGAAPEVPEPVEGTGRATSGGGSDELSHPGRPAPLPILQPHTGPIPGDHYLAATPTTVLWGRLPCATDAAVLEIAPGETVTFDTVSHEGILDDQGKDPGAYFAAHGVPREQVLDDAVEIAASVLRDPVADGPHVVVGPVHVTGAHPGDLLKITVETLVPRVPYGVISNRHGKGALVGELPRGEHNVSVFAAVDERGGILHGTLPVVEGGEPVVAFPLAPFLGTMGVAVAGHERPHSVPPGTHGGNIDINLLVEGTTLFLPVQVEGALAYVGDPHFAQGDGEVALTALEASLRATLRFEVIPADAARAAFGEVTGPLVRTPEYLVPTGMHVDLDEAMRACVRASLSLLNGRWGMDEHLAYAYLSAATDFDISQVVDIVSGVHARIREADFAGVPSVEPEAVASGNDADGSAA